MMMPRKFRAAALACFLVLMWAPARPANAADRRDKQAVQIAHAMMEAMGGENGWNSVHFVRFDFKVISSGKVRVRRRHLWDKFTGRYRLETKTKKGLEEVVLFNTYTKEGKVYVGGKQVEGERAAQDLKKAYAEHINDMYWLAEPWKWLDPGVNLQYEGARRLDGETYDVVHLSFNHVGLTPGDQYWAYVSPRSHLMTHWRYLLQSGTRGSWNWYYGDFGGVKLARDHVSADKKTEINMGDVRVLKQVDGAYFADPGKMLSELK